MFEANGRDIAADLRSVAPRGELSFDGYVLDRVQLHECDYNWKTFIEVYLEDYHVGPFHPGLGQFVSCEKLHWEFGDHHSVQTVGANNALAKAGSAAYRKWHDALLAYRNGEPPKHGAIWLTYYPNVMVEWYPHVLVVSTLHPKGPQKTLNVVEFFYPEEIVAFEREFVEAEQAAYWETCAEDDEIALRMDAGRKALMDRLGVRLGVVVTDTLGRPWRAGQTDAAIGAAGVAPLRDYRGTADTFGIALEVSVAAVADFLLMARPPGKKNSTIHLLSGGEKALTAVALVFSIFELNPAPFCLLDEVDAPLDDANVGRFSEIVREMSEHVQFVIITHNKTTMEAMHQLAGVTMQEPGVSRMVAVDIDEAVRLAAM